jgi:hypothetical protein
MPGSMRKRGDSWELRVYAGTDPETGKRQWRSATTKGTRRAAQRALVEFAARIDYPRRMTAQATVAHLLDDWYAALSPNWSPTTTRQTKSVIDCHLVPRLGHLKVATLRTEDIDALYGERRQSGGRDGQPLSPGTVHRIRRPRSPTPVGLTSAALHTPVGYPQSAPPRESLSVADRFEVGLMTEPPGGVRVTVFESVVHWLSTPATTV